MTINRLASRMALIACASTLAIAGGAQAQTSTPSDQQARIEALEAQLKFLQQQINDLKAASAAAPVPTAVPAAAPMPIQVAASAPAAAPKAAPAASPLPAATVSIAAGRPTIASTDGAFTASLHGVMQLDTAHYFQDKGLPAVIGNGRDLNSGSNFRRARLGLDGRFFRNFDYSILLDFGGNGTDGPGMLQELFVQYNYAPFKVRVGAFAPSVGLSDAASQNGSLFPERPAIAEMVRGLAAADRRYGLQVQTSGENWLLSAAATGGKSGDAQTFDEQQAYVGRAAFAPIKSKDWLLHLGVNGGYIATPAQAAVGGAYALTLAERPELRVDGATLVSTGALDARNLRHLGAELAVQHKSLLIQSEVFDLALERRNAAAGVSDPKFGGWYVEGGLVLTGESRRYNASTFAFDAPSIAHPFDPKAGQWGAWELAARYSVLDLNHHELAALAADRVRGGEQTIWSAGVNWFPNSVTKVSLDYLDVDIDRLDPAGGAIPLSQGYQAVNLRSQFAF
ncbi:OprO/OprP family phosphate-selective porin [Caulobacter endophyticus]|nr:porin [Caulobacter endophyticus]